MGIYRRLTLVVLMVVLAVGIVIGSAPQAEAVMTWQQAQASQYKDNMDKVIREAAKNGFGNSAIAGWIANVAQESGFNPAAKNYLGCAGLVQFCPSSGHILDKELPGWQTSAEKQVDFILKVVGGQFANPRYQANVAIYGNAVGITGCTPPHSIDEYKKMTDAKCAALAWAAIFERYGAGEVGTTKMRAQFAQDADKSGYIAKITGNLSSSDNKSETPKSTPKSNKGVFKESELTGMPDQEDYSKAEDAVQLPNGKSLSAKDANNLVNLQESTTEHSDGVDIARWRVIITILGILLILYGIALGIAAILDYVNLFGVSVLNAVTFGRMNLTKNMDNPEKDRAGKKKVMIMVGIAILMGMIIISGAWSGMLLQSYWWVTDQIVKFKEWQGITAQ